MSIMDVFSKNPEETSGHERYLFRFQGYITNPNQLFLMNQAYRDSKEALRGKYRGDKVTYSFKHARDVADFVSCELGIKDDWELNSASLLHDTVEDGNLTLEWIAERYGANVAHLVDLLTKNEDYKKNKSSYVRRLRQSKDIRAIILKLADRVANLRTLGFKSLLFEENVECELKEIEEFQIRQINETIDEYMSLANLLIDLMKTSSHWNSPSRRHIGIHLKSALETQIISFRIEYGNRIIA